eukprot:TRINITY_DN8235_c0_g1_i1.p1 TRINITY_DN8235_c0_g1~~TRINITY_DN8235_c0_g1_i1.p1  ORF type:complete len:355 (-),score=82.37 TRINITY_DN8235_c0_g1_i1:52-1116(-)
MASFDRFKCSRGPVVTSRAQPAELLQVVEDRYRELDERLKAASEQTARLRRPRDPQRLKRYLCWEATQKVKPLDFAALLPLSASHARKEKLPLVLDLGCGDGDFLIGLHRNANIPWNCLIGVGQMHAPPEFEEMIDNEAFVAANLETLPTDWEGRKGVGSQHSLIVSFMTWHHLVDPLGSLALFYDEFLAPGGVMAIAGVPLGHLSGESGNLEDDLQMLAFLQRYLDAQGHDVQIIVHHYSTGSIGRQLECLWLQRKPIHREDPSLKLPIYYAESGQPVAQSFGGMVRALYFAGDELFRMQNAQSQEPSEPPRDSAVGEEWVLSLITQWIERDKEGIPQDQRQQQQQQQQQQPT